MKKNFRFYVFGWATFLIIFNVIAAVVWALAFDAKFTPAFLLGWGIAIVSFIAQLICAWISFKDDSPKKTFYNIPWFVASYIGLIVVFLAAVICMLIKDLPYYVAAIIYAVILIATIVVISQLKFTINIVSDVDAKVDKAVAFIYEMRSKSEALYARESSEDIKETCRKVRDAFKYSDPMSKKDLAVIELDIRNCFNALKDAVIEGNTTIVNSEADDILMLIAERNNKCKRLK